MGGFHCHAIENKNQNRGMSEANYFRCYRISINKQIGHDSRLCSFPLLSCSSKCATEIYRPHYGDAILVLIRGATNMAARNNTNIWNQYRHKFDQLLTANEQIISLNTFSNTFTIQRA